MQFESFKYASFKYAYIYEFLGDHILASQYYFLLSKQYFKNDQNGNPVLSADCLKQSYDLIRIKASNTFDPMPIANFLEKLDRDWVTHLLNNDYRNDYNGYCNNYLKKILLEKDAVRIAFEKSLDQLKKFSNGEKPRCFICFNVDETDVQNWLSNTLVPDLKRIEVETIFTPNELKIVADSNNFVIQIYNAEFAIIACTPLLKKKFNEQNNAITGSIRHIKLAIERFKYPEKYEATYLIYLKGDHQSSCPSVPLEPFFGEKINISGKITDFNYYSHTLNLFAAMRKVNGKRFKKIEYTFESQVKEILFKNEIDESRVNFVA